MIWSTGTGRFEGGGGNDPLRKCAKGLERCILHMLMSWRFPCFKGIPNSERCLRRRVALAFASLEPISDSVRQKRCRFVEKEFSSSN